MPTQADGKAWLQITVGCDPGSEFCGECDGRLYDCLGDSDRVFCRVIRQMFPEGTGAQKRHPACLSAEAAYRELEERLTAHQDMLQTAAEDYTQVGYNDGYNAGLDAARAGARIGPETLADSHSCGNCGWYTANGSCLGGHCARYPYQGDRWTPRHIDSAADAATVREADK